MTPDRKETILSFFLPIALVGAVIVAFVAIWQAMQCAIQVEEQAEQQRVTAYIRSVQLRAYARLGEIEQTPTTLCDLDDRSPFCALSKQNMTRVEQP